MGAWIEICMSFRYIHIIGVAPFMGAWIEINNILVNNEPPK